MGAKRVRTWTLFLAALALAACGSSAAATPINHQEALAACSSFYKASQPIQPTSPTADFTAAQATAMKSGDHSLANLISKYITFTTGCQPDPSMKAFSQDTGGINDACAQLGFAVPVNTLYSLCSTPNATGP